MSEEKPNQTYKELLENVLKYMTEKSLPQTPQLSSSHPMVCTFYI